MAKLLKLRRGTTSQHSSFTGAEGEVTIDTNKDVPVVHDGSTAGGHPVAAEDMANVSSANILGRISNGDIVGTKLENSGVSAGSYGSSSAIPILTVDAQGLVTNASTTAIDSTTISQGSASVAVSNNGPITSNANHDFSAGIDVTGNITGTSELQITHNSDDKIVLNGSANSRIKFLESGTNRGYLGWDSGQNGFWFWNNEQSKGILLDSILKFYDGTGYGTVWHSRNDGSGSGLDADSVDGLEGGNLLRSDTADTAQGDISFTGGAGAATIAANSDIRFNNGSWTGESTKIQHHSNFLYIQGGSNGTFIRKIDGTNAWLFDANGHFYPNANNTFDIGTSSNRVRNIYTNDLHLSNIGHSNDVDGTWGDWTIQEGESDLFLKNNRSGKKYKFNLTEVS